MTCQGLPNGNFECSDDGNHSNVNNFNACENAAYISSGWLKQFGIDCCTEEARYSMLNFSEFPRASIPTILPK